MTTFTLPTPVFEPAGRDWDGKKSRSRKVNFPLEGTEVKTDRGVANKFVQISFFHSKDRKVFTATANQVTITVEPGFGVATAFWPFNGVSLQSRPVARFSEKALEAFVAEVMAVFPALVDASEKLQRMFTVLEEDPS